MKRFWCTTCCGFKRVRQLPDNVQTQFDADSGMTVASGRVADRKGTCDFHARGDGMSRAAAMSRKRVISGIGSTRKMSASSAKTKSKKG